MSGPSLVWFRRDLRLSDNPAWAAATKSHRNVVALFVVDPRQLDGAGQFRRAQLGANLEALDATLADFGGRLLVRYGDPIRLVPREVARLAAEAVHWNADVSPASVRRDALVQAARTAPTRPSTASWPDRSTTIEAGTTQSPTKRRRTFRSISSSAPSPHDTSCWQWVAGTGPDAAPYFRIFNPITQSRTHDPDARYLRRWLPELAELDNQAIHAPWEVGPLELAVAGVTLGSDYPAPIVDHAAARARTLAAYKVARTPANQ